MTKVWEPPIAYSGAITGFLVQSALFCEYKPLHDARNLSRITEGEARRLTRRMLKALRSAERNGRVFVKSVLVGELDGYPLIVSPDAVYFVNGVPRAVVKSRIRGSLIYYESDWAGLILASHILLTQYKVDTIIMVLIVGRDGGKLRHALIEFKNSGIRAGIGEGWKIITRIYDDIRLFKQLRSAIDVLVGRRMPRRPPTSRCRVCPYRDNCPWST